MLQYDFDESVGYWICMTSHVMRRALNTELAREKITLRQWEVLACLALSGPQSQAQLAEQLGVEAPTLAGILSRMERDGWLERCGCTEDRRKKIICATDQAEAVWNRMCECARRVRMQAIEGISAEELASLKTTCETIRRNLERASNGSAGRAEPIVATGNGSARRRQPVRRNGS